jgi:hypothetical protein
MPYFADDPRRWRDRAEHARRLAEELIDPAKQAMLGVAAAYERMAERADARANQSNQPPA